MQKRQLSPSHSASGPRKIRWEPACLHLGRTREWKTLRATTSAQLNTPNSPTLIQLTGGRQRRPLHKTRTELRADFRVAQPKRPQARTINQLATLTRPGTTSTPVCASLATPCKHQTVSRCRLTDQGPALTTHLKTDHQALQASTIVWISETWLHPRKICKKRWPQPLSTDPSLTRKAPGSIQRLDKVKVRTGVNLKTRVPMGQAREIR